MFFSRIRLLGPAACNPSQLNFHISNYAKDPLETFHKFDSALKSQVCYSSEAERSHASLKTFFFSCLAARIRDCRRWTSAFSSLNRRGTTENLLGGGNMRAIRAPRPIVGAVIRRKLEPERSAAACWHPLAVRRPISARANPRKVPLIP